MKRRIVVPALLALNLGGFATPGFAQTAAADPAPQVEQGQPNGQPGSGDSAAPSKPEILLHHRVTKGRGGVKPAQHHAPHRETGRDGQPIISDTHRYDTPPTVPLPPSK